MEMFCRRFRMRGVVTTTLAIIARNDYSYSTLASQKNIVNMISRKASVSISKIMISTLHFEIHMNIDSHRNHHVSPYLNAKPRLNYIVAAVSD